MRRIIFFTHDERGDMWPFEAVEWPFVPAVGERVCARLMFSGKLYRIEGDVGRSTHYMPSTHRSGKLTTEIRLDKVDWERVHETTSGALMDKVTRLTARTLPCPGANWHRVDGQINYLGQRYMLEHVVIDEHGRPVGLEPGAEPIKVGDG